MILYKLPEGVTVDRVEDYIGPLNHDIIAQLPTANLEITSNAWRLTPAPIAKMLLERDVNVVLSMIDRLEEVPVDLLKKNWKKLSDIDIYRCILNGLIPKDSWDDAFSLIEKHYYIFYSGLVVEDHLVNDDLLSYQIHNAIKVIHRPTVLGILEELNKDLNKYAKKSVIGILKHIEKADKVFNFINGKLLDTIVDILVRLHKENFIELEYQGLDFPEEVNNKVLERTNLILSKVDLSKLTNSRILNLVNILDNRLFNSIKSEEDFNRVFDLSPKKGKFLKYLPYSKIKYAKQRIDKILKLRITPKSKLRILNGIPDISKTLLDSIEQEVK